MALERHHKIIIGSFSSVIIIILIANSIFLYILYGQLQLNYNSLENEIQQLQVDTQTKFNDMSTTILNQKEELISLGSQLGSMDQEFAELKATTSTDFSGIIEKAIKGVVTVKTNTGQGTGFFITKDGYLITNEHVIDGATAAGIITYDGELHQVKLIGVDARMDIGLLKIEGNYDLLDLGNSNDISVGEKVIAIGNPLGLQFSVSEGIISAVHRAGPNNINAYIQTDAALNPGNSGGPLINKKGEVIGINNFKIGSSESLGFALESNYIKDVVNQISMQVLNQTLI